MQFIESLTDRTPLFAADAGAGAVAKAFGRRPTACAFPVTDEHASKQVPCGFRTARSVDWIEQHQEKCGTEH